MGSYVGPLGIGQVGLVCTSHARYFTELLSQDPFSDSFSTLDFSHSRRVANGVGQAFNKGPWDFYRVSLPGRPVKSLLLLGPQLFAYQRERIGERGVSLAVPSHLPKTTCGLCHLAMGKQSDHREQPQQCRCGPAYCQIRPLTLRLESQMPSYLLEGHFQLPTYDEPREDLLRIGLKIGTQEGLSFELSFRITD